MLHTANEMPNANKRGPTVQYPENSKRALVSNDWLGVYSVDMRADIFDTPNELAET
jgi:hypothetical protein